MISLAESLDILCHGLSAKSAVGPVMVESVSEGVDEGTQLVEAGGQAVSRIELVAPG